MSNLVPAGWDMWEAAAGYESHAGTVFMVNAEPLDEPDHSLPFGFHPISPQVTAAEQWHRFTTTGHTG